MVASQTFRSTEESEDEIIKYGEENDIGQFGNKVESTNQLLKIENIKIKGFLAIIKAMAVNMETIFHSSMNEENLVKPMRNSDENNCNEDNEVTDSCKVFIGGIHQNTSEETIRKYLSRYGNINDVMIGRNPETKRSRGFWFVTCTSQEEADTCLKSNSIQ